MKKILLAVCCCALAMSPLAAQKTSKTAAAPAAKPIPEKQTKGLFNVIQAGAEYFFEVPDSLIGRRFLTTVRFTATPAGIGEYGGEQINEQTVYWEKAPNDMLLLRSELLVNTADSIDNINKAILLSNENPIIGSFKIESKTKGLNKIKVTSFFMEDNPALGLPSYARRTWQIGGMLPPQSYIESIKTFPTNTEVRLVKTWTSQATNIPSASATGKLTFGLNVSFVLLPKVPMMRRLFDPRVGYFTDRFVKFSDFQQTVDGKRFITRWRLEPKDSAAIDSMKRGFLVEPKKQIVYYIDPATPKRWRKYLIDGVNDWQVAFEKAGFKNAIVGKEWPENDSTMSMEDARYSVIRYLASPIPNAYGPNVHDPRSGEILESHIGWYHNVMKLLHDWYMIQAGTLDEAARAMRFDDELMGQLIRFVSSHEVGHTLGLRHNFGSSSTVPVDSLRSKSFVEAHGHTPSIMDYARFNYVAQPEDSISHTGIFPRIGDYDKWAIEWGYTPMWNAYDDESDHWEMEKLISERLKDNPRLWFGDGETNHMPDPRCQTEDLGDDAMKASYYGLLNLKRIVKELPDWTYQGNDIYNRNLSGMWQTLFSQAARYAGHVLGNIGGVYYTYKTVDAGGSDYRNVPRAKQKEALDFLNANFLKEPTWLISESYVNSFTNHPVSLIIPFGNGLVKALVYKVSKMNEAYPAKDYLADLTAMVFKELADKSAVSEYRRALQSTCVESLCEAFKGTAAADASRPYLLAALKSLEGKLKAAGASDPHFASLADVIARTLVINGKI